MFRNSFFKVRQTFKENSLGHPILISIPATSLCLKLNKKHQWLKTDKAYNDREITKNVQLYLQ